MAEYHSTHTVTGIGSSTTTCSKEILWATYQFVTNSSNAYLQIATHNSNNAVYLSSSTDYGTPTSRDDFGAGAYLVFEPVTAYPGGGRWQCQITHSPAGTLKLKVAIDGGWDSTGTGTFGSNVVSTEVIPLPSGSHEDFSKILFSSAYETYKNTGYTYFRALFNKSGANCDDAIYVGGYVPFDSSADTKPLCVLTKQPTSSGWGATGQSNSTPSDYAHTATTDCYIQSIADVQAGKGDDRAGNYIAPSAYLFDANQRVLGIFGPNTFRGFDSTVSDWSYDASGSYIVAGAYLHRYTVTS